jgi:glycosyltransferase 2 family protein
MMKNPVFRSLSGLAFGGLCLWLAIRQVDGVKLVEALGQIEAKWLVFSLGLYALDVAIRIRRWQGLLNKTKHLKYGQVAIALIAGYTVNNLLPARLGEIYRANFIKRQFGISRSSALGSIVIERLMDGISVTSILGIGILALAASGRAAGTTLTIVVLVSACVFTTALIFVYHIRFFSPKIERLNFRWLNNKLADFAKSLEALRDRTIWRSVGLTIIIYSIEILMVWAALKAVGVDIGPLATFVVLGATALSTLIPTAPGYIGSLQLAYILSLQMFGFGAPQAFVAATVFQVFLFGSLVIVGLTILFILNIQAFRAAQRG